MKWNGIFGDEVKEGELRVWQEVGDRLFGVQKRLEKREGVLPWWHAANEDGNLIIGTDCRYSIKAELRATSEVEFPRIAVKQRKDNLYTENKYTVAERELRHDQ